MTTMHEQQLLAALALKAPGIEMHMNRQNGEDCASVATLYEPEIRGVGTTLFEAAFEVARPMLEHPQAPREVTLALEEHRQHHA